MRCTLLVALGLVVAGPGLAQSGQFDGIWATGDPAACVEGRDSLNFAYRIRDGEFMGLESSCMMTNPVEMHGLGGVLFDMQCVGEGTEWSYELFLMIDNDGALVRLSDGFAQINPRCTGFADGSIPPVPMREPSK